MRLTAALPFLFVCAFVGSSAVWLATPADALFGIHFGHHARHHHRHRPIHHGSHTHHAHHVHRAAIKK